MSNLHPQTVSYGALASLPWEEQTKALVRANLAAVVVLTPPESAWQSHLLPFISSPRLPGLRRMPGSPALLTASQNEPAAHTAARRWHLPPTLHAQQSGASPGKRGAMELVSQFGFGLGMRLRWAPRWVGSGSPAQLSVPCHPGRLNVAFTVR